MKKAEVMRLDCDVICMRSHLGINPECNRPLIVFVNCEWISEKTAQYCQGVSLKLEYKLNFLHKTHKR